MNKRYVGWIALLPAIGLIVFALYSVLAGEHTVSLSAADIQQRISSRLPRDISHSRMRVTTATVSLRQDKVDLHVDMESQNQNLVLTAASTGTPEFRPEHGQFFFHPENVVIENLRWKGRSPEEIIAGFHSDRLSAKAETVTAWANRTAQTTTIHLLNELPVYSLSDEGKGWIIKSALKSVTVHDDRLWIVFSLQQLTLHVLLMAGIGLVVLLVVVIFLLNPEMFAFGFFL